MAILNKLDVSSPSELKQCNYSVYQSALLTGFAIRWLATNVPLGEKRRETDVFARWRHCFWRRNYFNLRHILICSGSQCLPLVSDHCKIIHCNPFQSPNLSIRVIWCGYFYISLNLVAVPTVWILIKSAWHDSYLKHSTRCRMFHIVGDLRFPI